MRRTSSAIAAFALLAATSPTRATTFTVAPGPGTPVRYAVDAASPGDTIRLASGAYPEAVTITKSLKLVGPRGSYLDA